MAIVEPTPLTREVMRGYFAGAFKPRGKWLIGMELEKLGRAAATGAPLPYSGSDPSVRGVLEYLWRHNGGQPVYEGDHLIGVHGDWGTLSLEPGGQLEWSSRPARTLDELRGALDRHLDALREAGQALGVRFLDVAVDPEHPVEAMRWMPKARYKIMRPYMGARGRLAHRMMTQTASIQCAFDFESAEDWARKFRAGALLAPIAVALFANSERVDGKPSGYRSFRQHIWRETEPDRCGLPAVVFEPGFGIDAWVDWICNVPSMFRYRSRGLVPAGGVPFAKLLELRGCDALKPEDWELHLSSLFTEVRSYAYIEVRSADLQPDSRIFAVPAFWTGILYHEPALERVAPLAAAWDDHASWTAAMDSAARDGLDGRAGETPLRELAVSALGLAATGLRGGGACMGNPEKSVAALAELARQTGLELEL